MALDELAKAVVVVDDDAVDLEERLCASEHLSGRVDFRVGKTEQVGAHGTTLAAVVVHGADRVKDERLADEANLEGGRARQDVEPEIPVLPAKVKEVAVVLLLREVAAEKARHVEAVLDANVDERVIEGLEDRGRRPEVGNDHVVERRLPRLAALVKEALERGCNAGLEPVVRVQRADPQTGRVLDAIVARGSEARVERLVEEHDAVASRMHGRALLNTVVGIGRLDVNRDLRLKVCRDNAKARAREQVGEGRRRGDGLAIGIQTLILKLRVIVLLARAHIEYARGVLGRVALGVLVVQLHVGR